MNRTLRDADLSDVSYVFRSHPRVDAGRARKHHQIITGPSQPLKIPKKNRPKAAFGG